MRLFQGKSFEAPQLQRAEVALPDGSVGAMNPPLHTLAKSDVQNRRQAGNTFTLGNGQVVRNLGLGNVRKRVILGGFLAKEGSKKGSFWPKKRGKRPVFELRRGNWWAERDFLARIGHYVSANVRPKSTPGGDAKGETDARRGCATLLQLPLTLGGALTYRKVAASKVVAWVSGR